MDKEWNKETDMVTGTGTERLGQVQRLRGIDRDRATGTERQKWGQR